MTPLELCEPIFTKICVLNRLGRSQGGLLSYDQLRSEIEQLFTRIRNSADADPALKVQWQKLELPLTFFVDSMISESGLAIAATWNRNRLAYERKELTGDEKFFDLLDETLNDPSDEASQRLVVFYTAIGTPVSLNICEAKCWMSASVSGRRWKRTKRCGFARKRTLMWIREIWSKRPPRSLAELRSFFWGFV
jgi:hypothetical protein